MPYNFKIGDKAIIVDGIDIKHRQRIGEIVTIDSDLMRCYTVDTNTPIDIYLIEGSARLSYLFWNAYEYGYRPCDLKPYYDGLEKGSWDDCEFKPKELICQNKSVTKRENIEELDAVE